MKRLITVLVITVVLLAITPMAVAHHQPAFNQLVTRVTNLENTVSSLLSRQSNDDAEIAALKTKNAEQDARIIALENSTPPGDTTPPPVGGYFPLLLPIGAVLPSDCASQIHRSTWEPRPDNTKRNNTTVNAQAVHDSFATRLRASEGTYDPRWDSYLLPRVDGQFAGTTDEIFQWAACKWGIPDNVIRAVAVQESTWYQYLAYPSNRCVSLYGCGDFFGATNTASTVYCNEIATFGYDYQQDYGAGQCPQTFSILGIKSYWDPGWGFNWAGNQNGAFPFNRNSTAFAADYYASQMRGCYEGWILHSGAQPGDLRGCVGMWFSGAWHDAAADQYASEVQVHLSSLRWLDSSWPSDKPGCHPTYGCPGPDGL